MEAWDIKFWELRIKGVLDKEDIETITIDQLNPALKALKNIEKEREIKKEIVIHNGVISAFNEIFKATE